MLENLSIPDYSLKKLKIFERKSHLRVSILRGENVMGAGNQQERPIESLSHYVAGFVDGEGTFHVAIQRRKDLSKGFQLIPEFHVSQHREKTLILEKIKGFFGCGYVKPNHPGSSRDLTNVYIVRNRQDLLKKIIPFFERYPLISEKQQDFQKFAQVVRSMEKGKHLTREGLKNLTRLAFSMYGNGRYRKLKLETVLSLMESSETVRQLPKGKDTVRAAWRHAEVSRND